MMDIDKAMEVIRKEIACEEDTEICEDKPCMTCEDCIYYNGTAEYRLAAYRAIYADYMMRMEGEKA